MQFSNLQEEEDEEVGKKNPEAALVFGEVSPWEESDFHHHKKHHHIAGNVVCNICFR
jgi:hypothetical protein